MERAQEARSDFTLTDRNAGVVADICARLEGLPLAIELAAAKVKLLSLPDLLSRLEHPLQLLTGGARDLPERHQVLSNALQSSYDLLSPRLQRIFPRLGPFVAPFTLQAAESVADAGMEDVASLIDASLLQRQGLASDAGEDATVTRYNMLVTLREFAVQELELRGDLEAARRLHAAYFAQLADTARTELRGAGQKVWMGNLTVMIEDIRAALSWSMECGDAETALRIAGSLFNFWYFLGELTEGRQWLKRALALEGAASADVRAQALHAAGTLAWYQGDLDEGQALLAASLLLRRELGDKAELGRTINNLGLVAHARGEYESALALLTEGLELHREAGDLQGVATSLGNVAMISYVTGNYAQGIEHLKEGLALYRSSGDKFGELRALNDLAAVTIAQGDFARAREYSEESLPLARVLNDRLSTAFALATGGQAARMLGEHEYARRSFAEALVLFQQAGYRAGVAECFENLAAIAGATDNPARSARLYGAAEVLRESIGVPQDPPSVPDYERNVAAARAQSDERSWKEAWAEGRAMPVEQASDYAMEGSAIAERDEHTGWH